MSKQIELLKGLFGEQVSELSEDQVTQISQKLDKLIETRVNTKVKFQTEVIEAEAKEKYDALLKESTEKFDASLKTVETKTCQLAESFKKKIEDKTKTFVTEAKKKSDADVQMFKESLVEKLDKYLDLEMEKKVPDVYVEAVAQVSVLQPIVEGFKHVMEENYIKFDAENFGLLKDARKEIIAIREELAKTMKENMDINSNLKEAKRTLKISKVCEGLTDSQRERASKLLESYDVEEIDERYSAIRDIIIEGEAPKTEGSEEGSEEGSDEKKNEVETKENLIPNKAKKPVGKDAQIGKESVAAPKAKVPADANIQKNSNEPADKEGMEEPVNEEKQMIREWADNFRSQVSGLVKKSK
jgi:hypothetical protein